MPLAPRGAVRGATLYVTLEPCSSAGRTPACTDAVIVAGLRRGRRRHRSQTRSIVGRAFGLFRRAGIKVAHGLLAELDATRLNQAFNHWIVHRTPFVIVKAAMTLDGGSPPPAANPNGSPVKRPAPRHEVAVGSDADARGHQHRSGRRSQPHVAGLPLLLRDRCRCKPLRRNHSGFAGPHAAFRTGRRG